MLHFLTRLIYVILALSTFSAAADTVRYAVKQTDFAVRAGKSFQERALITIKGGDAVVVLEADNQAGWSRVQTSEGIEGWIQNKYLTESPPSATDRSSPKLEALKAKHELMESELAKLRNACLNATPAAAPVPTAASPIPEPTPLVATAAPTSLPSPTIHDVPKTSRDEEDIEAMLAEQTGELDRLRREWFLTGVLVTLITAAVVRLLSRTP